MSRGVVARLLDQLRPEVGLMSLSALCRIVNQGLGVMIPVVATWLVVGLATGESVDLMSVLLILGGLALVKGVFRYLEQLTGHAVAFRILALLRARVFVWLARVEPADVIALRSGDLLSRVTGDIDRVEPFYAHTIAPLVAAVLVPAIVLISISDQVPTEVVLYLAAAVLVYLVVVPLIGWRGSRRDAAILRERIGDLAGATSDVVRGAGEITLLGAEDQVLMRQVGRLGSIASLRRRATSRTAWRASSGAAVAGVALVVTTVTGMGAYQGGAISLTTLASLIVVSWTLFTPLRPLEQIVPDTEAALGAATRLFQIEDLPLQAFGSDRGEGAAVQLDGVGVSAGEKEILTDIGLTIPAGAFVGVVGPSGAGKSTLVDLLTRRRDPDEGVVSLGGVDVASLSSDDLTARTAVAAQGPAIFSGSIAENLRLAAPDATDDELWDALSKVDLDDWVKGLPEGMDTRIGDDGIAISGGQGQRLAIARLLLRDPEVVILDEATSQLDVVTERTVMDAVRTWKGSRTLVVVAHRLETLVATDFIVVLNRGTIDAIGTHEELVSDGGLYAGLWQRHQDALVLA